MLIWLGIGVIVAIWFCIKMDKWAYVGNRALGSRRGTKRLLLLLPAVVILWPFVLILLVIDSGNP